MQALGLGKNKGQPSSRDYPEPIDNQAEIERLERALQDMEKLSPEFIIPRETHLQIRQIEEEKEKAERIAQVFGAAGVASSLLSAPLSLIFLLLGWRPLVRYEKLRRLVELMKELDKEFKDKGVEMAALVEHPTNEPVDLLVRFPGKHFFLVCIRSYGDAEVFFDEKRQKFFQKKANNKGRRGILLDPVDTSMQQIVWLQKHYRLFFGGTSRAAKRPLSRILVVWPPSRLGQHREELYKNFGSSQTLEVRYEKGGGIFAVNRQDMVKFLKEYLAFRIDKEKGNDGLD